MADMKRLGNKPVKVEEESLLMDFVGLGTLCSTGYVLWWMLAAVIG